MALFGFGTTERPIRERPPSYPTTPPQRFPHPIPFQLRVPQTTKRETENKRKIRDQGNVRRSSSREQHSTAAAHTDPPTHYLIFKGHSTPAFFFDSSCKTSSDHSIPEPHLMLPHEATAASAAHPEPILTMSDGTVAWHDLPTRRPGAKQQAIFSVYDQQI